LALIGLTSCGSVTATDADRPVARTTTPTVGVGAVPPSTVFSTTSVPTAEEQGIPVVALGRTQSVAKFTDAARITLVRVLDPVAVSHVPHPVAAGSRTIGLEVSVRDLRGDTILGLMERDQPSLTFVVYGTNRTAYFGFQAVSPQCAAYSIATTIPVGSSFTGCAFATLPRDTGVAEVVISLDYGGAGGTPVAWRVSPPG
jgi:hypothetical protein